MSQTNDCSSTIKKCGGRTQTAELHSKPTKAAHSLDLSKFVKKCPKFYVKNM